jgi:peptidoglycan/LPS O-acetylase OafA/YrhL
MARRFARAVSWTNARLFAIFRKWAWPYSPAMGIAYRPEIDGLRAIAVLAVVLYHAGIGGAGFVGVDVFFVISGYLITLLLLRERRTTGRTDLLGFYARRVRRIFPAAAAVVLAVIGASSLLLSPEQQAHTAQSAGAALLFGANVFFQVTTGGYFDGPSDQLPLLHLWSLSVEEQFYFLWPALLMLIPRRWLVPALCGLAVASFAAAEYWIAQGSQAAFYEMPARFWELAAGGLIAASAPRVLPRWLAPAGIVLTLAACAWPLGHFPGVGALPAVLGACAIIAAVHGGATNPLLRSKLMVGIGLISYSLYLWHWPLLACYRANIIGAGSLSVRLTLCAIALVLALGSYRYIERPFRRLRLRSGRTVVVGAALSSALVLCACAVGLHARSAMAVHADNQAAVAAGRDMATKVCHISGVDRMLMKCQPRSDTLVWGDSMAWSWLPAFPGASDVSMDSCEPFIGWLRDHPHPGQIQCRDHNNLVLPLARKARVVVLGGLWNSAGEVARLAPTLDALDAVPHVIVIGPTPTLPAPVPQCIRQHAEAACTLTRAAFDAHARPILAALQALAGRHPNVSVVDPSDDFCTATGCPPLLNGKPLYWDSHHITRTAAASLADRMAPASKPATGI